jgi:multicomponent K+:H+ antiporter subunit E
MGALLRYPLTAAALLAGWLLLWDSIGVGQLLLGALIAAALTAATADVWPERPAPRRPLLAVRFLLILAWDILVANLRIAVLALHPTRRPVPVFVEMPVRLRDPFAVYLLAVAISLTPGTLSADVAPRRRSRQVLLIHALDSADPGRDAEMIRRKLRRRYEQPLLEIFG